MSGRSFILGGEGSMTYWVTDNVFCTFSSSSYELNLKFMNLQFDQKSKENKNLCVSQCRRRLQHLATGRRRGRPGD